MSGTIMSIQKNIRGKRAIYIYIIFPILQGRSRSPLHVICTSDNYVTAILLAVRVSVPLNVSRVYFHNDEWIYRRETKESSSWRVRGNDSYVIETCFPLDFGRPLLFYCRLSTLPQKFQIRNVAMMMKRINISVLLHVRYVFISGVAGKWRRGDDVALNI